MAGEQQCVPAETPDRSPAYRIADGGNENVFGWWEEAERTHAEATKSAAAASLCTIPDVIAPLKK